MSTNPQLRQETAQDIRLRRDMERQIDNDAGRAKIIETFAEIQEAEAKGRASCFESILVLLSCFEL